jgi:hypothetical protein
LLVKQSPPCPRRDGPEMLMGHEGAELCSPHLREWSHQPDVGDGAGRLLPAPAGLAPRTRSARPSRRPAPCTRRDGPCATPSRRRASNCSLRREDDPGRAKLMVKQIDCSPHPRGWSPPESRGDPGGSLLPVPAGMVPLRASSSTPVSSAPRTGGDGSSSCAWPATYPRCSPHPRGWSRPLEGRPPQTELLAPAGMAPQDRRRMARLRSCYPRSREWSRGRAECLLQGGLLPAPAGMVPCRRTSGSACSSAPRTRGDGPGTPGPGTLVLSCSPHPRGWSPGHPASDRAGALLPAPAGMVPRRRSWRGPIPSAPRTRGDGPFKAAPRPARGPLLPAPARMVPCRRG